MQSFPGELSYTSPGNEEVCGLYIIGLPEQIIEIEFLDFDVRCDTGGLLAVSVSIYNLSRVLIRPAFCICEKRRISAARSPHSCFCYIYSKTPLT